MYRLMIEPEISVESTITVKNMQAEVKMGLSGIYHINNHCVINSIVKDHNACPFITGEVKDGDNDITRRRTREQLRRLTDKQRKLIIDAFKRIDINPVKIGLQILVKLFTEHPQYKQIWPQFRAIPDSSLMDATALRKHACVYMSGMRTIIHSMLDEDKLAFQMDQIAKAHIKWNIHRIHIMHMLQPLLETLKEHNDGQMGENTETAWTTFYDIIANLIQIYREKRT